MELNLFETLKEAYKTSTHSHNRFKDAIKSIHWDKQFEADGEMYFNLGGFIFMIQSFNPFLEKWKPSAIFSDGSFVEF